MDRPTQDKSAGKASSLLAEYRLRRFGGEHSTYWSRWLQYWNIARPAWPLFLVNALICLVVFGTDQGREAAKFAMTYAGHPPWLRPFATGAALLLYALGAHELCWRAVSRDYPFTRRAAPTIRPRFILSAIAGLWTPLAFLVFFMNTLAVSALGAVSWGMAGADDAHILRIPLSFLTLYASVLGVGIIVSGTYDLLGPWFRHGLPQGARPLERAVLKSMPVLLVGFLVCIAYNGVLAPLGSIIYASFKGFNAFDPGSLHQAARTGALTSLIVFSLTFGLIKAAHRFGAERHYSIAKQFVVFRPAHNRRMIGMLVVFLVAMAAFAVFPGWMAGRLGPVFTLLLSLGGVALLLSGLTMLASHNRGYPVVFACVLLLGVGPILGEVQFHNVAVVDVASGGGEGSSAAMDAGDQAGADIPYIEEAVRRWRASRPNNAPAIIVLAEGGGIRAALHTASLMTCLEESMDGALYDNIFALSGVSGGAVGVSAYLAARADGLGKHVTDPGAGPRAGADGQCDFRLMRNGVYQASSTPTARDVSEFLQADFFSPALAGLVFRDLPLDLTVLCVVIDCRAEDRAVLFEDAFKDEYADLFSGSASTGLQSDEGTQSWRGNRFSAPFLDVVQAAGDLTGDDTRDMGGASDPLVFMNTFDTKSGRHAVVSNVTFRRKGAQAGQAVLEGPLNLLDHVCDGKSLSLATAAHMSARFPLVSPPGRLELDGCSANAAPGRAAEAEAGAGRVGLFVDGGYFDNSGASAAQYALRALREQDAGECAGLGMQRYTPGAEDAGNCERPVIVIHAIHRSHAAEANTRLSPFYEIVTPVQAVAAARGVHGDAPIQRLCESSTGATAARACRRLNPWLADAPLWAAHGADAGEMKIEDPRTPLIQAFPDLRTGNGNADGATRLAPELVWMRSPLQFASEREGKLRARLPLGWLLGETGPAILQRVDAQVRRITPALACYTGAEYDPATAHACLSATVPPG